MGFIVVKYRLEIQQGKAVIDTWFAIFQIIIPISSGS